MHDCTLPDEDCPPASSPCDPARTRRLVLTSDRRNAAAQARPEMLRRRPPNARVGPLLKGRGDPDPFVGVDVVVVVVAADVELHPVNLAGEAARPGRVLR